MSEPNPPIDDGYEDAGAEGDELQFDQAEPANPTSIGVTCAGCKRPIEDEYYEINGKIVCTTCSQQIAASLRGGSGFARLLKASVFGFAAAVLGAAVYYGVQRVTGLNIGYVAILVGFLVGGAVRKGTGNRGGLLYQFLALILSYLAIGLMLFVFSVEHVFNGGLQQQGRANVNNAPAEKNQPPGAAAPRRPAVTAVKPNAPKAADLPGHAPAQNGAVAEKADGAKKAPPPAKEEKKPADEEDDDEPTNERFAKIVAYSILAGVVIIAGPVWMAIKSPISGAIYCITLFHAWKMNKRAVLALSGPFQVIQREPDDPHALELDDAK
jgi:hypothetical protein